MRVTSSMYYDNLFGSNNTKLNSKLFDVNKQIASGLKIQYANEGVATFVETMQLDNEMTTLGQIKKSVDSGYKFSNQTDVILNDFGTSMDRMKALLISSANAGQSSTSLDAIAKEMRGLESHLKNLANTSINGQFLFSGSAVDIKPIDADGIYNGNASAMNAFLGSQAKQQYNLTGAELFLGEEVGVKREVTSNVPNLSLTAKYPDFTDVTLLGTDSYITPQNTIRDLMGDTDNSATTANTHYFYLRGTQSDGTAFNTKIVMQDDEKIDGLLSDIGKAYGNTANVKVVNVSMNDRGEIVVEDKMKGSSKLDFHLVGAVDFSGFGAADVTNIDALDGGETNFLEVINPTTPPANQLYIKEFIKSSLTSATGAASNIEGLVYDRTNFSQNGSKLSSNVAQILKDGNAFALPSTKISEVASGSLDGTTFKLVGKDINGIAYDVSIDFLAAGSQFTIGGNTYDIFNMANPRVAVNADDMTYQQLMDVVNMAVTGTIPAAVFANADDYDTAIKNSKSKGQTALSYDGKLQFSDATSNNTKATLALFDSNSGDFTSGTPSSVMAFNANNALTVRDPKTDFFKAINEIIRTVEDNKAYPDGSNGSARSVGIQNAISIIDDLQDHLTRSHTTVGAQSNALSNALDRTTILETSTMTLRSSVIDTDLAESSLRLSQLTLNYQALLSTVGKVSKLSLVNYL